MGKSMFRGFGALLICLVTRTAGSLLADDAPVPMPYGPLITAEDCPDAWHYHATTNRCYKFFATEDLPAGAHPLRVLRRQESFSWSARSVFAG